MNTFRNVFKFAIALVCASVGLSLLGSNAHAVENFVVRCDDGEIVQEYLDTFNDPRGIHLYLVGTCLGFVIEHDDVVIDAHENEACPGATVIGGIEIAGGQRVELTCIAVTDAEDGVTIFGGEVVLSDVEIYGNDGLGLYLENDANVDVSNSSIHDNVEGASIERGSNGFFSETHITDNAETGLYAVGSSSLGFVDGSVTSNDGRGILVQEGSSLNLERSLVSENGRTGVRIGLGSNANIEDTNILNNVATGLAIAENSFVDWRNGNITGNLRNGVLLTRHSMARIFGGTQIINNGRFGIAIAMGSGVDLQSDTVIPDNGGGYAIDCDDKYSSVRIAPSVAIGGVKKCHEWP